MLKDYPLSRLPAPCRKVWGRTTSRLSPLTLFWTGSALELNLKAGELWAEVETGFAHLEQWAAVIINGELISRFPLPPGRHWLCLFRGMNPAKTKSIRFVKEVQAMPGDPQARLQIHALRTDGEFLPVSPRPRKLEFIGDSITSGEGLTGAKEEEDWIPMFFSAVHGFPLLTAELCGAECRVISQSGWGVRSGWDNDPRCALPKVYSQICGPLTGEENIALGSQEPYHFAAWQPDAVIVNLGTNDGGAIHQPPWRNPATGESFRQTADPAGRQAFQDEAAAFLHQLREKNPKAFLLWAYGMLGRDMAEPIRQAVSHYQQESGDRRAAFLLLPDTTPETIGSRGHSGKKAHALAAQLLAHTLKTLWEEE